MAVKVTITVEITTPRLRGSDVQTLVAVRDELEQGADWFAAAVVEQNLAEAGANLVHQVAGLHGDVRNERPDAVRDSALRARPLTATRVEVDRVNGTIGLVAEPLR